MNTYLPLLQEKTEPLLSYVPDVSNMSTYLPILQHRAEPLLSYVPDGFNAWTAAGLAVALAILYPLSVSFYNLFFSPLARFPGPKLAAATGYYEFYYDFFRKGSYVFEIEKMHNKYGQSSPNQHGNIFPDTVTDLEAKICLRRSHRSN
jgi:hypothetical protein